MTEDGHSGTNSGSLICARRQHVRSYSFKRQCVEHKAASVSDKSMWVVFFKLFLTSLWFTIHRFFCPRPRMTEKTKHHSGISLQICGQEVQILWCGLWILKVYRQRTRISLFIHASCSSQLLRFHRDFLVVLISQTQCDVQRMKLAQRRRRGDGDGTVSWIFTFATLSEEKKMSGAPQGDK